MTYFDFGLMTYFAFGLIFEVASYQPFLLVFS